VRAKTLASGPLFDLCASIVALAVSSSAIVIVNDRADLARMSGAAGVHVGQDDLSPVHARRLLGNEAVVGLSTHTVAQVQAALREPINYIAVGPVFGTLTKDTGYDAVGIDLVSAAARLSGGLPVVAIGGITLRNARSVIDAGATAVAVIGDLLATSDPRGRADAFVRALA
jgi:thiamine-phosphate pyrophosphorylase